MDRVNRDIEKLRKYQKDGFCEGTTPKPKRVAVAASSSSQGFQQLVAQ